MPDGLNFLSNVEERECAVYDPSVFPVPCVIGPPRVRMRWGTQRARENCAWTGTGAVVSSFDTLGEEVGARVCGGAVGEVGLHRK